MIFFVERFSVFSFFFLFTKKMTNKEAGVLINFSWFEEETLSVKRFCYGLCENRQAISLEDIHLKHVSFVCFSFKTSWDVQDQVLLHLNYQAKM